MGSMKPVVPCSRMSVVLIEADFGGTFYPLARQAQVVALGQAFFLTCQRTAYRATIR